MPAWLKVLFVTIAYIAVCLGIFLYADQSLYDMSTTGQSLSDTRSLHGFDSLRHYDVNHYIGIIKNGYSAGETAFFPLYPLIGSSMISVSHLDPTIILTLISIIFAVLSSIVIYYWVNYELKLRKSKVSPWVTLTLVAIFPTSLYMLIGYTESLFIFLTVSAIFCYRKGNYLISAVAATLASATRTQGAILAVFFLADYLLAKDWNAWKKLLPVIGAGVGVLSYCVFLYYQFGNPLEFIEAQKNWGRVGGNPLASLVASFRPPFLWYIPVIVVGMRFIWKYLERPFFWYSLAFLLLPISSGRLDSLNRYMLACLPMFLALTIASSDIKPFWKNLYIISSSFLLAWSVLLFFNDYWVA